jgi:hypothetical protein
VGVLERLPYITIKDLKTCTFYMRMDGQDASPGRAHLPYRSKKACEGVEVIPLWEYLQERLATAELKLDETEAALAEANAQIGKKVDGKSHGGWMPKYADLAACIFLKQWRNVTKMVSDHYYKNHTMQTLVDQRCAGKSKSSSSWQ